jgi:anti-anti-sigma factor
VNASILWRRDPGELDIASRDLVRRSCLDGTDLTVVVDMTDLAFIDCSGYGALIAARRILTDLGGSLTMRNQSGQPADLIRLLSDLEAAQLLSKTSEPHDNGCLSSGSLG